MIRLILIALCSVAFAREDPFVPLIVPKDSVRPYYGETSVFDKQEITLPSNARLIKKIDITYQNIDGSIETKSVAVSGRVDWRMPLVVSQVLNPSLRKAKDSSKDSVRDSTPQTARVSQTASAPSSANAIVSVNSQAYKIDGNRIFIAYEGDLKRHFIMKNPNRIVLDFDKNIKYYHNNRIRINEPYFTALKYGLHSGFLRIVVHLDGSYVYNVAQSANGVTISVE